jgi:hypothetical protein
VQRVSGGSFFLDGMVFRNSAQREISVMNIAQSSAQISDFIATSNAWSTLPAIQTIRPAAGIISLWTNGVTNGAALDTFISQHQTLIDTFKSVDADVILMSGPAISTAVVSDAVQLQYIEAYNYLAHRNRLRVYHPRYKFGNYSAANNAGIMRDDRHLIAAGDTAFAADLVPLLLS